MSAKEQITSRSIEGQVALSSDQIEAVYAAVDSVPHKPVLRGELPPVGDFVSTGVRSFLEKMADRGPIRGFGALGMIGSPLFGVAATFESNQSNLSQDHTGQSSIGVYRSLTNERMEQWDLQHADRQANSEQPNEEKVEAPVTVTIQKGESLTAAVSRTAGVEIEEAFEIVQTAGYKDSNVVYEGDKFEFEKANRGDEKGHKEPADKGGPGREHGKGEGHKDHEEDNDGDPDSGIGPVDPGGGDKDKDKDKDKDSEKGHIPVTICHATGSETNPFVEETVDDDAVDGNGNNGADHNRDGHQNGEDIIPPGSWDNDGRNWDSEGRVTYNNGCEVPVPTATVTGEVPTKTASPEPTRTSSVTATKTVEVSSTPKPTETPKVVKSPTKPPKSELTPTVTPPVEPRETPVVRFLPPTGTGDGENDRRLGLLPAIFALGLAGFAVIKTHSFFAYSPRFFRRTYGEDNDEEQESENVGGVR